METVVGWSVGTGWAVAVALRPPVGTERLPVAVHRERVELAGPSDRFVYHQAADLDPVAAEVFVAGVGKGADEAAAQAVDELTQRLDGPWQAVLVGPEPPWDWPDLADIVASHTLVHTAEGHFFREAIWDALVEKGHAVAAVQRKGLAERLAGRLGHAPAALEQTLRDMGRPFGPPWRREQKEAVLAAWWGMPV